MFGTVEGKVGKSAFHYFESTEEVRCLQQTNSLNDCQEIASKGEYTLTVLQTDTGRRGE
jgi:hypothetical protein